MNEELQKELLNLLRDLKTNASPVWNELLAQYVGVHFATGIFYACACIPLLVYIIALTKGFLSKTNPFTDREEGAQVFMVFSGIVVAVLFVGALVHSSSHLMTAYYPLGGVIGKVL